MNSRNPSQLRFRRNPEIKIKDSEIDYKNLEVLRKFTMENARIIPRRITGVTAEQQRKITEAIKIDRFLALLPYTDKH